MAQNIHKYQEAVRLGEEFNAQEKWNEAIASFRIALGEFKDRPEVYDGLAIACIGRKQYGRALDCYKLAARSSSSKLDYLIKITDLQERMGQLHNAARTYLVIGETHFKNGRTADAIDNWERAIRLDQDLLGAHQRLALAFQRQDKRSAAVREYLAIARILNAQGKKENARKICEAALRLEPDNPDIHTAIELIEKGAEAFDLPNKDEEDPAVDDQTDDGKENDDIASVFSAVRQAADHLESTGGEKAAQTGGLSGKSPAEHGLDIAREDISEELFREDDENEFSQEGMLKLERDALIGQALHYQDRGDINQAIRYYERAIDGGLNLSGAWFMIGTLYLRNDQDVAALQAFEKAGADARYASAVRDVLSQ